MENEKETHAPIRQSVHVDCPVEDAFRLFTEGFGEWWPGTSGAAAHDDSAPCAIEPWAGGRIFGRIPAGDEREWGSVTVWDPPRRLEFTWNPDAPHERRQTVNVEFQVEADGTRVTLTHSGWHHTGVAVCGSRFARFVCEQVLVAA